MTNLDNLAKEVNATAVEKGFWPHEDEVDIHFLLSKLALVHSEVSEVLEALRKQKGEFAVVEEVADTIIRLLDVYEGMRQTGWVTSSLDGVLENKMKVNQARPQKHGNLA